MTSGSSTLGNVDATTSLLRAELPRLEEHQQELEKKLATVTERLESVRAALSALQALSSAPPVTLATVEPNAPAPALVPAARTEAETVTATEAPAAPVETAPKTVTPPAPARRKAAGPAASRVGNKAAKAPVKKQKKAVPAQKSAVAEPAVAKPAVAKPAVTEPAAAKPAAAKPAAAKPAAGKAAKAPANAQSKAAVAAPAEDTNNLTAQVMEVVTASGSTPVRARDVAEALGRELTTSSINTVRSTLDRLVATSRAGRAGRGLYRAPSN